MIYRERAAFNQFQSNWITDSQKEREREREGERERGRERDR